MLDLISLFQVKESVNRGMNTGESRGLWNTQNKPAGKEWAVWDQVRKAGFWTPEHRLQTYLTCSGKPSAKEMSRKSQAWGPQITLEICEFLPDCHFSLYHYWDIRLSQLILNYVPILLWVHLKLQHLRQQEGGCKFNACPAPLFN